MDAASNKERLTGVGKEEMQQFSTILHNVSVTNLFPVVLDDDKYKRIDADTYEKGTDHLIKVFCENDKWQYKNLRRPDDRGSLIDFLANRLQTEAVR